MSHSRRFDIFVILDIVTNVTNYNMSKCNGDMMPKDEIHSKSLPVLDIINC
jgi:hypothetical protein